MPSSVPLKYKDFVCPICEGTDYKQVAKSNEVLGPGGRVWIEHCVCKKCSVIFKDAKKFSKTNTRK